MATATTEFATLAAEAQKQALASIKQAQDLSIKLTETAVAFVKDQPTKQLVEALPTPANAIDMAFDFAAHVLKLQKDYAIKLAETVTAATQKPKA